MDKTIVRDNAIVQGRLQGKTYVQLAEEFRLSKSHIGNILTKPEIRTLLEGGTAQMISMIPLACQVQYNAMIETSDKGHPTALALKASETVLKAGAILPSNAINQTVNAVFNIQNNVTLSNSVASAIAGALSVQDDDVVIDVTD